MKRLLLLTMVVTTGCQTYDADDGGTTTPKDAASPDHDLAKTINPGDDLSSEVPRDMATPITKKDAGSMMSLPDLSTPITAAVDMATPTVINGNDKCASATVIPMTSMRLDLVADTTSAVHDLTACAGTSGADVFFSFQLTDRELVYADTFGASWDTSLFFASSCTTPLTVSTTAGDSVCNDDSCGTTQSQIVAVLNSGTYYLGVSGKAAGKATVHFEHAPVGRGPLAQLPSGSTVQTGTTTGLGSMFHCMGAGAENSYWWATCPSFAGGAFSASSCGGTTWDSVMYIQVPRANSEVCNDDTCGVQAAISTTIPKGAGMQIMTIDGATGGSRGAYSLTVMRP